MPSMVLIHLFYCLFIVFENLVYFFQVSYRKGIKYLFVQFNKEKQRLITLSGHPGECAPPTSHSCGDVHHDHFSFASHSSLVSIMRP